MHFVLAYKVKEDYSNKDLVRERLNSILADYEIFMYQESFMIVRINRREDWDLIRNRFIEVYNALEHSFSFIMSPVIMSGRYNGMMIQRDWEIINRLTINP